MSATEASLIVTVGAAFGLITFAYSLGMDVSENIIRITLRKEVELSAGRVTIGDIAEIVGGSAAMRMRLAQLELEEKSEPVQELLISQRRVSYRLQLTGIDLDMVRIEGASLVRVKFRQVQTASAVGSDAVLVTARSLQPGEVLCIANTRIEYRPSEPGGVSPATAYGRAVNRTIAANQVVRPEHLVGPEQTLVIKKGEFVRMIARVGPLEVSTRGEALADGKIGQVIPVRNTDSKQVIQARILRPATVQVEY